MENGKKKFSDWSSSFEKNIIKQDRVITDDSSMITLVALSDLELKIIGALIFHSPKILDDVGNELKRLTSA